jgi:microcin C transport system ATP-binding protein
MNRPGDRRRRQQRVLAALDEVGLDEAQFPNLLSRYPHEFSGGQRQRLAIARALIVQPQLLVLDEPTSALDVTIQKQVLALLQRLQRDRGLSYLLITHDVDVIRAMAHDVMVMKDGEIVEAGPLGRCWMRRAPLHPHAGGFCLITLCKSSVYAATIRSSRPNGRVSPPVFFGRLLLNMWLE